MAVEIGTAANYDDLLTKLRDFLTTNAELVASGQAWTVLRGPQPGAPFNRDSGEILMRGPGTSGNDEVLVGIEPVFSVGSDYYNVGFAGYSSHNPGFPLADQPGRLENRYIHLWDGAMPYWFVANGRRFIVVVRVTTVYQSAYCGFILPYHLPTAWAYPLFIGGCSRQSSWRYSVVNHAGHSAFFNPGNYSTSSASSGNTSSAIRLPDGQWCYLANKYQSSNESSVNNNNTAPWAGYLGTSVLREGLDGQYVLPPAEIAITHPYPANLGALDGVRYIPGFGTASENTVTIDGTTYLVVQNVYRTSNNEYAAIALE